MKDKRKTPSKADLVRAKEAMRKRSEKEARFKAALLSSLPDGVPCHDIWVWLSTHSSGVSYIFPTNADLENKGSGNQELIEATVARVAKCFGAASMKTEYHSHEHVLKEYNGNYWQFFR